MPPCHGGDRRFESARGRKYHLWDVPTGFLLQMTAGDLSRKASRNSSRATVNARDLENGLPGRLLSAIYRGIRARPPPADEPTNGTGARTEP